MTRTPDPSPAAHPRELQRGRSGAGRGQVTEQPAPGTPQTPNEHWGR